MYITVTNRTSHRPYFHRLLHYEVGMRLAVMAQLTEEELAR